MVTESFIYWFTRLDHLHAILDSMQTLCGVATAIAVAAIVGSIGAYWQGKSEDDSNLTETASNIKKRAFPVFIASLATEMLLCTAQAFIPTTKEMASIYVIPKIANNENVQDIGNEMLDLAKDWLKELHPAKKASTVGHQQKN